MSHTRIHWRHRIPCRLQPTVLHCALYAMVPSLKPHEDWPERKVKRWYSDRAPDFIKPVLGIVWPEQRQFTLDELAHRHLQLGKDARTRIVQGVVQVEQPHAGLS